MVIITKHHILRVETSHFAGINFEERRDVEMLSSMFKSKVLFPTYNHTILSNGFRVASKFGQNSRSFQDC